MKEKNKQKLGGHLTWTVSGERAETAETCPFWESRALPGCLAPSQRAWPSAVGVAGWTRSGPRWAEPVIIAQS